MDEAEGGDAANEDIVMTKTFWRCELNTGWLLSRSNGKIDAYEVARGTGVAQWA